MQGASPASAVARCLLWHRIGCQAAWIDIWRPPRCSAARQSQGPFESGAPWPAAQGASMIGTFIGYARQHMFVTVFGVVIPFLVFVCFIGFPIVYTIYLSFFEWNGMTPAEEIRRVCQLRLPLPRQIFLHSTGQQRQVAGRFAGLSRFGGLPDRLRDEGAPGVCTVAFADNRLLPGDHVADRCRPDVPFDPQSRVRSPSTLCCDRWASAFWCMNGSVTIALRFIRWRSFLAGPSLACR